MIDTEWHSDYKECGPFDHEDEWDKSWVIPIEFKMHDGKIKKTNLIYTEDEHGKGFDYDENSGDFCAYFDVYDIVAWRFPVMPGQLNNKE